MLDFPLLFDAPEPSTGPVPPPKISEARDRVHSFLCREWMQADADRRRLIAEFYDKKCSFKRVRYQANQPADGKLMIDLIRGPLCKGVGRVGHHFLDLLDGLAEKEHSNVHYFAEVPKDIQGIYSLSDDPAFSEQDIEAIIDMNRSHLLLARRTLKLCRGVQDTIYARRDLKRLKFLCRKYGVFDDSDSYEP